MKDPATINDRLRITLRKDMRFLPGQVFALKRSAEGVLLRPLKPDAPRAKPSARKHLHRKGWIPVWSGPIPDVDTDVEG